MKIILTRYSKEFDITEVTVENMTRKVVHMSKLVLVRKGMEVTCGGKKLTIVAQATKGPGKEVVKVEGCEGSNGQKWISLTKLPKDGTYEFECEGRDVVVTSRSYQLTNEEKVQVDTLQAQIDAIISKAKERYVPKPSLDVDPSGMTEEAIQLKMEQIRKYYGIKLKK